MKVIQVVNGMNIGGIETFIMNVYRNIDRSKYEFIFLTNKPGKYDYQDEIEEMGGRIIRIDKTGSGKRIKHIFQLIKIFSAEQPDVVHCHTYYDAVSVMLAAKLCHVKIRITHSHTTEGAGLKFKTFRRFLSWLIRIESTNLVACGEAAGMALYKKNCFEIINNGIDLSKYYYNPETRSVKRCELGIKRDAIIVAHIGRFVDVKNHSFIVDVAKELEKVSPKYVFVFVGDGPLRETVKEKAKRLGVDNKIILLGNRSDIPDLLNAFDAIIFPSKYEGIPMSLIEAQANGLPIYASDTISEESKINSNFIFTNLNVGVEKWAQKIRMSDNKRIAPSKRIDEYSIETTVRQIRDIYEG